MDSVGDALLGVFMLAFLALVLFFMGRAILFLMVEPVFVFACNRPLYVHAYLRTKRLDETLRAQLRRENRFYARLSTKRQRYFDHRVVRFLECYEFEGRNGLEVTDAMKTSVAAAHVMLTFGMRTYLPDLLKKVILYPDVYYSPFTKSDNKGEFNPMVGAVVFSWRHFQEGHEIGNDNLHLGIHEFTHLMHLYGERSRHASSSIFSDMYGEIVTGLAQPGAIDRVRNTGYFRDYAFTNAHEFMAVVLEHFFETPAEFRAHFPLLYEKVATMINYRER